MLRKLAGIFGCPGERLPAEGRAAFEAGDDRHGRGPVDLRELADEFAADRGEFFDFEITVGEIIGG